MGLDSLVHTGSILSLLIAMPMLGAIALFFSPRGRPEVSRSIALIVSLAAFVLSLLVLRDFDGSKATMQFAERVNWFPELGVNYVLGVDGISIWLVVLTTFLTSLVILASTSIHEKERSYLGCILFLETGMLGTFLALDAVLFYVFWELMLVPMYFLIGVWGGKRKIYAAIKFVLYTAFGSLLMLVAIVYLAQLHNAQFGRLSFFLGDWLRLKFTLTEQLYLFGAFALAFAIKIPLFPLHTWLPDAHVEAPTGGSVILAGVLLKMGLYGLIRFCVPVFPEATYICAPLFMFLGVVGIVYGALVAWVQTDIKKLVAYSSVSHLGFCVLGFAALSSTGWQGSVLQMLNHGVSTGALFFLVGVLYDRKHTREIAAYGGLAQKIPVFCAVFLVFTLSSIGLPLTNGFVGEFLLLLSGFRYNWLIGTIAVSGVVLGAMYMLSLYRRVCFGAFDETKNGDLTDLTMREKLVFAPLLILVFWMGLYPQYFLDKLRPSSDAILASLKESKLTSVIAANIK